jgi:hypothetical protein
MTTYEKADLAQNLFDNSLSTFAVLLSVVFAYIVTAYLVGAKLTRTQVCILTTMFIMVSILLVWSVAGYLNEGVWLYQLAYPDNVENFFAPKSWLTPLTVILGFLFLAMALKLMWDVRHPKPSKHG